MIDHQVRGRFNAWFEAALEGYMHRKYADTKSSLFEDAPPVVVELGPGSGPNLRYMPRGTRLIAIEPNRHMYPVLKRRAQRRGIELDLHPVAGENLDLPTASVDFVFSCLVLCTVEKPEQVIAEVRRVLRPGGRFACIEHVAAPAGSTVLDFQRLIRRQWKWLFEGCDLCRDIASLLRSSRFAKVEIREFVGKTIMVPLRHQIVAVCVN